MDPDPDPGGPKAYGSGSGTLISEEKRIFNFLSDSLSLFIRKEENGYANHGGDAVQFTQYAKSLRYYLTREALPAESNYRQDLRTLVKYGVRSPKFIWALCEQLYSLAETLQPPPPRIWTHIRAYEGAVGQPG